MITLIRVTDSILFSAKLGPVVKISDGLWVASPFDPGEQSESLFLKDKIASFVEASKNDILYFDDFCTFDSTVLKSDTFSISDFIFVNTQKTTSDRVLVEDSIGVLTNINKPELVKLIDSMSIEATIQMQDDVTIVDGASNQVFSIKSESFTMSEEVSFNIERGSNLINNVAINGAII